MSVEVYEDYPLARLTTLKIGGNAEYAFFPKSVEEFKHAREFLNSNNKKITILGAGSNVLISSNGIDGGVIFTNNLKKCQFIGGTKIKVQSGMKSPNLAKILQKRGLAGMEFMIGIPGSVGGAITMNSSAHGQCIKDVIVEAEVYNIETDKVFTLSKDELALDYRDSFVEANKHLILNATFELTKADKQEILENMDFHVSYRAKCHPPLKQCSAGSTFRNPADNVYVGQLLEELEAMSWSEGKVQISSKHANFLHAKEGATSTDVSRLMHKMHSTVKEKYGYDLIAEIRYIGNYTEEEKQIWDNFQVH